jgi:hypothetical protein
VLIFYSTVYDKLPTLLAVGCLYGVTVNRLLELPDSAMGVGSFRKKNQRN